MPNGGHTSDQEWKEIRAFFDRIDVTLNAFAERHGLFIDKYYHDAPDWTFRFGHPKEGNGQIEVMKNGSDRVNLYLCWYRDDYDRFTRSLKVDSVNDVEITGPDLSRALSESLETILGWPDNDWSEVVYDCKGTWSRHTKEEFQNMKRKFAVPKNAGGS